MSTESRKTAITEAEFWKLRFFASQTEAATKESDHAAQIARIAVSEQTQAADTIREKYQIKKLRGFVVRQTGPDTFEFEEVE